MWQKQRELCVAFYALYVLWHQSSLLPSLCQNAPFCICLLLCLPCTPCRCDTPGQVLLRPAILKQDLDKLTFAARLPLTRHDSPFPRLLVAGSRLAHGCGTPPAHQQTRRVPSQAHNSYLSEAFRAQWGPGRHTPSSPLFTSSQQLSWGSCTY